MTNDKRRRPSSANPTSRPRRIAGRSGATSDPLAPEETAERQEETAEGHGPAPESMSEDHSPAPGAEPEHEPATPTTEPELDASTMGATDAEPEPRAEAEPLSETDLQGSAAWSGFVESARTTRILLVAIVALALISLAGGIFLWVQDDDRGSSVASDDGSVIEADDETPVRISGEDAQLAVAEAAQAAYTIVATSWEDYDAQVDEAAALMIPAFAEEYRQTAEDVADAIVASKTVVQVTVVAQGVVRADQERVQALVFLNQYVTKDGKEPVFTPYRALVTVDNTDQGWLVSDLATK